MNEARNEKYYEGTAATFITGLYFDGRKDTTMVQVKECDGKFHRKILTEEHISIISEPGSSYFGNISRRFEQGRSQRADDI